MKIEVVNAEKELSKYEKVKLVRSKSAISLDEISKEKSTKGEFLEIHVDNFVTIHIENEDAEKEEDMDFIRYMIVAGENIYFTRSQAFAQEYRLLRDMMEEEIDIRVIRLVSNKSGKDYLSCELV